MRAPWLPDWRALMARAPALPVPGGDGYVYWVADSHLGDLRAPPAEFIAMLGRLEQPRAVVFLGDLFTVWLAPPKFREPGAQAVLDGFAALRRRGARVIFVVGNREFFVPADAARARAWGLPFDAVVPGAAVLEWSGRRYGITHGDLASRKDLPYLRWRWVCRSRPFEALFRALPGPLAHRLARRLERALALTNREIKIQYPADELRAFAQAVLPGLDGFFIGHFHRDETLAVPGQPGTLRIVPDWHARKAVLRLDARHRLETLRPG
jgi:UDP-2,3-diacylglucosamine hydrolase